MKSSQTIFNKDQGTVTITEEAYEELVKKANQRDDYREICKQYQEVLGGGDL